MRSTVLFTAACLFASPATASIVEFRIGGELESVEYDFGGPASAAFLAGTPLGSPYQFTFSYDTAATPAPGGPAGASYYGVASASLGIAGTTFQLRPTNVTLARDAFAGTAFLGLFGNFELIQPQLNGFRPIDLSVSLTDTTNTALATLSLPSTLDLSDFDSARTRVRFVGSQGETGLLFSVTSLTSGSPRAVPAPGGWALMAIGAAALAWARRRRGSGPAVRLDI